jgi:hypothetical protein
VTTASQASGRRGGARPGAGRKKTWDPRQFIVQLRVCRHELEWLRGRAARAGLTVSEFVRRELGMEIR